MFNLVRLPRGSLVYPITIARAISFDKDILVHMSPDELEELVGFVALHPERGDVIPGTGGVRKLRWGLKRKGKSKGLRIIYFYHDLNMPLFLLAVYSKGQRLRLTKREEMTLAKMAEDLKSKAARKALGGTASSLSAS